MAKKILSNLGNTKARTVLLFFGTIVTIGLIVIIMNLNKSPNNLDKRPSKAARVVANIDATPGASISEHYRELQAQDNKKRAEQAKKAGSSSISTIIGAKTKDKLKDIGIEEDFLRAFEEQKKPVDPQLQLLLEQEKLQKEEDIRFRKQQEAELAADRLAASNDLKQKRIEAISNSMDVQVKAIFKSWNDFAKQSFVQGSWEEEERQKLVSINDQANSLDKDNLKDKEVLLKAGDILFGVLDTAINSDEESPIMASIVHGKYKGSKLIGKIKKTAKGEKLILDFSLMSLPDFKKSIAVNIVAIDPNTARTAIASDVDHHYLSRYGSLFAAAFMEGYGNVIGQAGTTVSSPAGSSGATTTTKPKLSGEKEVFAALGKVGQAWGSAIGDNFNVPPTVIVDSGLGIGLLILKDITL